MLFLIGDTLSPARVERMCLLLRQVNINCGSVTQKGSKVSIRMCLSRWLRGCLQ